jgi:hypothetical protein
MEDFTYDLKNFEGICGFTVDVTLEDVRARSRLAQEIRTAGALYRYLYGVSYQILVKCLVLHYTYH